MLLCLVTRGDRADIRSRPLSVAPLVAGLAGLLGSSLVDLVRRAGARAALPETPR